MSNIARSIVAAVLLWIGSMLTMTACGEAAGSLPEPAEEETKETVEEVGGVDENTSGAVVLSEFADGSYSNRNGIQIDFEKNADAYDAWVFIDGTEISGTGNVVGSGMEMDLKDADGKAVTGVFYQEVNGAFTFRITSSESDKLADGTDFTEFTRISGDQKSEKTLTVNEVISKTIMEQERPFYEGGECEGEGHIILDSEEAEQAGMKKLTVYTLTMYGTYQFQDGNFVKNSGSGAIPTVFRYTINAEGVYKLEDYSQPTDGSGFTDSVHELFPESLWDTCISPTDEQGEELERQEKVYAATYLKEIGREAQIGNYGDFEHELLIDAGVSVEVSNKMSENKALYVYPFWIGCIEKIEDGTRYRYSMDLDKEKGLIVYAKINMDNQEKVESFIFDAKTGQLKQ